MRVLSYVCEKLACQLSPVAMVSLEKPCLQLLPNVNLGTAPHNLKLVLARKAVGRRATARKQRHSAGEKLSILARTDGVECLGGVEAEVTCPIPEILIKSPIANLAKISRNRHHHPVAFSQDIVVGLPFLGVVGLVKEGVDDRLRLSCLNHLLKFECMHVRERRLTTKIQRTGPRGAMVGIPMNSIGILANSTDSQVRSSARLGGQ